MEKTVILQRYLKNKTINLLVSSLLSAFSEFKEGTSKKENVRPQLFFWIAISFVFLIDTVVLQGFGFCIDDYEYIKQYYKPSITNPEQGLIFTLCTIIMGVVCSYINLLLFIWMKHFDEPLGSQRLPGYNFSRSNRFIIYLILFFILGYIGSFVMSMFALKFINLNAGVLFNFGNLNNVNFATPLRQMPECLIIMWSFLGFDFYLKSIKGQMEWRDKEKKLEIENSKIHEENEQKQLALNLAVTNLGRVKARNEEESLRIKQREIEVKGREEENRNRELLLKERTLQLNETNAANERIERELELLKVDFDFYNSEVKKLEEENKAKDMELKKLEEENRSKDIQQRIFKSQFDAHLLINVLGKVYYELKEIDEATSGKILSVINFFRYLLLLNKNDSDTVPLYEDVKHILSYISFNHLYRKSKLNVYTEQISDKVRSEGTLRIQRGLLDEFITNAFKYASIDIAEGETPFIIFKLSKEDDYLIFEVENTTIISDEADENSNSSNSGLNIIKDRLNHHYPNNHELDCGLVNEGMGRYIVKLKIRLNNEK